MRKISMNNIFEDKAFLMFESVDSSYTTSDMRGKAYFIEEDTGRVGFLYLFATKDEREQRRKREQRIYTFLIALSIPFLMNYDRNMPGFYALYSRHASVINNAVLLFGLTILAVFVFLWAYRYYEKKYFEKYQQSANNDALTFLDGTEKVKIFEPTWWRWWWMILGFIVILPLTIGMGYSFIATTNMGALPVPPLGVATLFWIVLMVTDRSKGWRLVQKMYGTQ